MGFRNDNEALRARAAAAEQRAGQAEEERERLSQELAEARSNDEADAKRIAALEKRLGKLEPSADSGAESRKRAALVGLAAACLMGAIGFVLLRADESPPSSTAPATEATEATEAEAVPEPEPAAVSALERVRLAGVVRSVDGFEGLEPGAGCVADRGLGQRGFETLQVRCGTPEGVVTTFDDAVDTGGGITQVSGDTREAAALSGGVVRSMAYSVTGQWAGPQAQIQLDSTQRALRIWRGGLNAKDLLVHLEGSAGSVGEVTGRAGQTPFGRGTLARLELRGEAPSGLGELDTEDCVLRTEPVHSGTLTARFLVRCGDRILYGAGQSGWVPAPALGAIAGPFEDTNMSATDTDPAMSYTVDTLTLVEPEWRVMFDVRPHPSCSLANGTWVGSIRGADDVLRSVHLADGALTLPDERVLEGEEDMRCHEGVARWGAENEPILEGRFGPYFATFVGRLGSGELLELYRTP